MNTIFRITLVDLAILLIAAACSPAIRPLPILDAAPSARNDKTVVLMPVTGEYPSAASPAVQAYPNQKLHRDCVSEDSEREARCVDSQSIQPSNSIKFYGTTNADTSTYPSQQTHSDCVSSDSQHQENCVP